MTQVNKSTPPAGQYLPTLEREDIHELDIGDVGGRAVELYGGVAEASWGIGIGW
tara:strand:- start:4843 stop:5004 length:162 start_codon:yes stop_codon:yes gene_type:complete